MDNLIILTREQEQLISKTWEVIADSCFSLIKLKVKIVIKKYLNHKRFNTVMLTNSTPGYPCFHSEKKVIGK